MELQQLKEEVNSIFETKNTKELKEKLYDVCINDKVEYYKKFKELVKDLDTDYLQKIYQYYEADREEKKQDYTPQSLAEFVAKLSETEDEDIIIDMCAGSGALTIQKWKSNKNLKFICLEYDENVIPFLLFNLAIRNIEAEVKQIDVLENELFKHYKVNKRDEFGKVEIIKNDNLYQ